VATQSVNRHAVETTETVDQLPKTAYAEEAIPLTKLLEETRVVKRRGTQQLGDLLP
jgi:hypothetical protein